VPINRISHSLFTMKRLH